MVQCDLRLRARQAEPTNGLSTATQDWVVLCSVNRVSSILVFVDQRADSVLTLASQPDLSYLQGAGDGKIVYSRMLMFVPADSMAQSLGSACDGVPLHDGINDVFVEKASTVMYWCKGKWLTLAGGD